MQTIPPRATDLGGLTVRRLLPRAGRRLVGPWCFLDLVGPLSFGPTPILDVPPHPHIGLQTVTWVLEGEILHKDSLGSRALAEPGTLNLMTSGRGVAHSEETPARHSGRLHAVQLWIALPDADRDVAPAFDTLPQRPVVELGAHAQATVILGELAGAAADGRVFSPLMAAEVRVAPGASVLLPIEAGFEHAVVPVVGAGTSEGQVLETDHLYFLERGARELRVQASAAEPLRALLIGGAPFAEPVLMWWNFVARTNEEIAAAREDWAAERRFGAVVGYDGSRLDAPAFVARAAPPPNAMS
jgi:quercetin 2,3-dioxygenase